jgi:hypothetical protein
MGAIGSIVKFLGLLQRRPRFIWRKRWIRGTIGAASKCSIGLHLGPLTHRALAALVALFAEIT